MAKPQKETGRHNQAFEYYLAIGAERSYAKVADQFGVSDTAVAGWASAFGWQNRISEREREVSTRVAEAAKTDAVKMVERQLKIVRAIQGKFVSNLQSGKASITANDFLSAAKHEANLTGYAPESGGATAEDIAELLRGLLYIIQTKVLDSCPNCRALFNMKAELSAEFSRLGQHYSVEAEKKPTPQ